MFTLRFLLNIQFIKSNNFHQVLNNKTKGKYFLTGSFWTNGFASKRSKNPYKYCVYFAYGSCNLPLFINVKVLDFLF